MVGGIEIMKKKIINNNNKLNTEREKNNITKQYGFKGMIKYVYNNVL